MFTMRPFRVVSSVAGGWKADFALGSACGTLWFTSRYPTQSRLFAITGQIPNWYMQQAMISLQWRPGRIVRSYVPTEPSLFDDNNDSPPPLATPSPYMMESPRPQAVSPLRHVPSVSDRATALVYEEDDACLDTSFVLLCRS